MSDIEAALESDSEQDMREAFEQQVEELFENEELYRKDYSDVKIGLETEYPAVDNDSSPIPTELRDQVIEGLDFADVEVGGSQVEVRTDPMKPSSLSELEKEMRLIEADLEDEASVRDVDVLRSGTHPFVDLDSIPKSNGDKYQKVPGFHDEHRNGHVQEEFGVRETIDPRNADLAAVINSTQTNIEARDFDDAVEKANYTYMISPFLSAISGNARFLDGKDTGVADSRMPIWEKSHDIRTEEQLGEKPVEAGKLESYYEDLNDYFERVKEQPFILEAEEAAMDIGIGTFWKDSRIKFKEEPENDRYDAIVESRVVSTQPTLEEEIAMHGFFVGRLVYAQEENEDLMDIEKVNRNRYTAMHNGLDEKLYDTEGVQRNAVEVLEEELGKAEQGLEYAGIDSDGFMDLLYDRLEEGVPADQMAEGFNNAREKGMDRKEAMRYGLENQVS